MGTKRLMVWALGVSLILPAAARALTLQDRVEALEATIEAEGRGVAATLGIDAHAMVMVDYMFDFNQPPSGDAQLSTFTFKDDTFDLRQASLFFSRAREDESWGFGLVLDFGTAAEAIAARWDSDGDNICGSSHGCEFEIREAYLTYYTPLTMPNGDPISLKAGKFATLLGWEVIPSWDALNDNISTSFLFGFAVPFTHVGLLANLPITDMIALDLGVVNGWDSVRDNNHGKTLLAGISVTPAEEVSMYLAGTYGAEGDSIKDGGPGAGSKTGAVTANAVWHAANRITFVLDSTYANESDVLLGRCGCSDTRSADWYGVAGYAVFQVTDDLSFALRTEWFDDPDGVRTDAPEGKGATLWEVTPTLSYWLTDRIIARAEYRHDESSTPIFESRGGTQPGQDLVSTEVIVTF